jgi:PAS domain S-box-containing protein
MPARARPATRQQLKARADGEPDRPGETAQIRGENVAAQPRAFRPAPRARWSTRRHLIALVSALLVPMLGFAAFLLWQVTQEHRHQLQREALGLADTLAASVDRQLQGYIGALQVLAASPRIDSRDIDALYREAEAVKRILDAEIVIKDASGQQLVNTRLGLSAPLPVSLPKGDQLALAAKHPAVSDLFLGKTANRLIVSVNVPIIRDGQAIGLVNAGMDPEKIAAVLRSVELPPDWLAAVVDGSDRIVARTRRHDEFVGTPATKDFQEHAAGRRGVWIGSTAEGLPVLGAYTRSALADWRVAVGVPVAVLERPLYASVLWLLGIGAATLVLSMLLAGFFAQRLAAPMRALAVQAERLGRYEIVQPTPSSVAELSNVSAALEQASAELRRREDESRYAETELRSSRNRLERVLDTSPVGIVEVDPHGGFIYINATAERILRAGRAELEGLRYGDMRWVLRTPEGRTLSARELPGARALAGEIAIGIELEMFDPADNRRLMLSVNAAPLTENGRVQSALIAFGDVTERHRTETALREAESKLRALNENLEQRVGDEIARRQQIEEALRQSQKMEAVGQLTGGVAHDFNNLLTIILGNLENLEHRIPADDPLRRYIAAAERGASRAAVLTDRLLAFSRRQPLAPSVIDVNELVTGMSELLQRTLGEAVTVETVLADRLWQAFADPTQLENALINLAVNARDAMPDGGRLTIETANSVIDAAYAATQDDLRPGQYVAISVADTGCGMSEEVLAKAFEPFFTTKEVGQGTGLGLSQVYGFIRQSGGHVRIDSQTGEGTTVRLYLPRHLGQPAPAAEAPLPPPPRGRREETVLVVEDDPDVRTYTSSLVRELGYRVLTAADGAAALDLLETDPEVQLLFTDVGLPGGLNGRQLADRARQIRPQLKVLYTTGYARDAIVHEGRLDPGVEVVFKPFRYSELALKIRHVLDA